MAAEKKLSKRDKKAQAFKKKSKKAEFTEEMAVPQADLEEEVKAPAVVEEPKKNDLKRKASTKIDIPTEEGEGHAKKKNRRPKKNNGEAGGSRYIVFIGNLPYTATADDLKKHFESAGTIKSVRFLTDKATGKPKGFAFMEFENSQDMNKALAFHHTFFKKRQINVELTAGGGGNKSESRKEKLKVKNERLTEERKKKHEEMKTGKPADSQSSYKVVVPTEESEF
ncbi:hypothetical protein K501DRAFT_228400 [Backusella circina FSU 941]|nr:hypothetical protein K501DRAFT_228400 [Backusella circina FSU 941]